MRQPTRRRLPIAAAKALGSVVLGCALLACCGCQPSSGPAERVEGGDAETVALGSTGGTAAAADTRAQSAALPSPLTPAELDEGWIALFDGATLFGWQAGSQANWRVEDGAIVVDQGEPGLLCTTSEFADYVLRLDFHSAAQTNSGIFLRTGWQARDPASDCYELNIAPADNPYPTGSLVQRARAEGELNRDAWQRYEITVQGDRVRVRLDGQEILDYRDPQPIARGRIGLQLNEGRIAFRNLRLKLLDMQPLFNGVDLTGWKAYPEMDSRFSVTGEGFLRVRDGRGQLETEGRYGDFALQLECITHAAELNSGVFFRCIPGDVMMGYECQIHNGYLDGDRRRPQDCGTGGIFRRQDARFIVADDQQWFYMTLVANGPHMAGWVNGIQVSDWTDDRDPDPNPRRGLRLEAGTIMLQGHDPTTDLSFRNLRIGSMD